MTEESPNKKDKYKTLIEQTRATRIKPGEVRNPDGRPPNKKYLSEIARELLEEVPKGELEGRNADILVVLALIRKALAGDTRAIEMLHDWTEGKVPDKHQLEGLEAKVVMIQFVPADRLTEPKQIAGGE